MLEEKSRDALTEALNKCIDEVYETFKDNSHWFWKEEDIQSYLYGLMMNRDEFYSQRDDGKKVFLVHREYRTRRIYNLKNLCKTKSDGNNGNRGVIDLVIWDPDEDFSEYSPDHKLHSAIEIKFERAFATGKTTTTKANFFKSFYNDYRKVTDPDINKDYIRTGYVLFFINAKKNRRNILFKDEDEMVEFLKEESSNHDLERPLDITRINYRYLDITDSTTLIEF